MEYLFIDWGILYNLMARLDISIEKRNILECYVLGSATTCRFESLGLRKLERIDITHVAPMTVNTVGCPRLEIWNGDSDSIGG